MDTLLARRVLHLVDVFQTTRLHILAEQEHERANAQRRLLSQHLDIEAVLEDERYAAIAAASENALTALRELLVAHGRPRPAPE